MPDPNLLDATGPTGVIIEKFGIAVASILGLLYVLRWLSQAHLKALNERINTLEMVYAEEKRDKARIQAEYMDRMEAHAAIERDMAAKMARVLVDNSANARATHDVLVRLLDRLDTRPCLLPDYEPHEHRMQHKTRSSAELPAPPKTDRMET